VEVFNQYSDLISHVQIGDTPSRGAPGTGDVDFPSLFAALRGANYDGWVSGEYNPGSATEPTLEWMNQL
jgi:hydroxypyruvate isomerase